MGSVKTAISIDKRLFERAERLAGELGVSRSRVFARALEEFLRRYTGRQIEEKFNEIYSHPTDEREQEFLRASAQQMARLTKGEQW